MPSTPRHRLIASSRSGRPARIVLLLCVVTTLAPLAWAGCGGDAEPTDVPAPKSPFAHCHLPGERTDAEQQVCDAYLKGLERGDEAGAEHARGYVKRKTADGYRMRRWTSLLLVGVGLWVVGTAAGAFVVTRLRRRQGVRYGDHVAREVAEECEAIREAGRRADPLVKDVVSQIRAPLAELERQTQRLAEQCRPLERRDAGAASKSHLDSLYRRLDNLAEQAERLHVQVLMWQERVARYDAEQLDKELDQARKDLESAMEETL